MILIDTHIWIWWADGSEVLTPGQRRAIEVARGEGIGVSAISCWEVGMLARKGRLALGVPVASWVDRALRLPGVESIALSAEIALASTLLPGEFHGDPADRFLVATSRTLGIPLLTADGKILGYGEVEKVAVT